MDTLFTEQRKEEGAYTFLSFPPFPSLGRVDDVDTITSTRARVLAAAAAMLLAMQSSKGEERVGGRNGVDISEMSA
jgi:hypothetical protein